MFKRIGLGLMAVVVLVVVVARRPAASAPGQGAPAQAPAVRTVPVSPDATGLNQGLASCLCCRTARTRSVCAENPTGGKGQGGMAVPDPAETKYPPPQARAADDLGQGWKVRPFLRVNRGRPPTLMDVDGPGIIQHIWMVEGLNRAHVLRFYWDGEDTPSVEVPAPDFFAVGHGTFAQVNSLAVVVNPRNALNCYWPMPFRKHARVTLTNESRDKDLDLARLPDHLRGDRGPGRRRHFHAQFRRASHRPSGTRTSILDGVQGRGRYVGTFLAWTQRQKGWFGEGEIKFYLDGDREFPTICGTGTEDYFCGSYGFPQALHRPYSGHDAPRQRRLPAAQLLEPLPLAHPGPDQLRAGSAGDHPGPGMGRRRQVQEAVRRHCLGRLLVPGRAPCAVSRAAAAARPGSRPCCRHGGELTGHVNVHSSRTGKTGRTAPGQGPSLFQDREDESQGATGSSSNPCVRPRLRHTGSRTNPWHPSA